ncbi:MAG TPA: hypothetical protein VIG30_06440 [Ktedonobacterales bacterium]|jgi:hypothetical protein
MKSWRTPRFKAWYAALPAAAQRHADEAYRLWRENPRHPGLRFKPIDPSDPSVYSVRIGGHYRAIGSFEPSGDFLWHWIGSHAEYDKLT